LLLWLQADEGKLTNLNKASQTKAARLDSQKARLQELAGDPYPRMSRAAPELLILQQFA
jgi:hypothetical protein